MKYREHEKEVKNLLRAHNTERQLLLERIAQLQETVEILRARAQKAEQKAVEIEDLFYQQ